VSGDSIRAAYDGHQWHPYRGCLWARQNGGPSPITAVVWPLGGGPTWPVHEEGEGTAVRGLILTGQRVKVFGLIDYKRQMLHIQAH
jgi:hypothetical protein